MVHSANFFKKGLGSVEAIIGVAIFAMIVVGIYSTFLRIFDSVKISHAKILAIALANEQFEIVRNLPYSDVGILGGIPNGKLTHEKTVNRDNFDFNIVTTVRNVDDPFDGTISSSPRDLSPADYKLVEVEVSCQNCKNFNPIILTTTAAPKSLESASTNGALFIKVFDANGESIPGVDVRVENDQVIPSIVVEDITDNNGMLQIVDAPPGAEAYEINVSKSGYSTERTYLTGEVENPNPVKPHATVAVQQVTQISFAIDKTSTINVASVSETCVPISNIPFKLSGSKLIGVDPNILKYSQNFLTDGVGRKVITGIEWDSYNLSLTDAGFDLLGINPVSPFIISPSMAQDVQLVLASKEPISALVSIKDETTGLPISGADVILQGQGDLSYFIDSKVSGRGSRRQVDWSGGGGQELFVDETKYFIDDGKIDVISVPEAITLAKIDEENYFGSGVLESSTFDVDSESNFYDLIWEPYTQPEETGVDPVKFQIATNNDNATWNFTGPDGTVSTYYTLSNKNINSINNGNRYLRYKLFLNTESSLATPTLSDVALTFSSLCMPSGQVRFSNLLAGNYTIQISKTGYQNYSADVSINMDSVINITLIPE